MSEQHGGTVGHETSDVDVKAILTVGAGLAALTAVVAAVIWLVVLYLSASEARPVPEYPLAATHEQRLPPEPRLQTNPREDLADLRKAEDDTLRSYGWVDKDAGVVHIPIGEAMRLTLERGLPARAQEPGK
jgi:hypothetical protein